MDIATRHEALNSRTHRAAMRADGYVHDRPRKSMGYDGVAARIMGLLNTRER